MRRKLFVPSSCNISCTGLASKSIAIYVGIFDKDGIDEGISETVVGLRVGLGVAFVGYDVGLGVIFVGFVLGDATGCDEGLNEAATVGYNDTVGSFVGAVVGREDGLPDGSLVGALLGLDVGVLVGALDGMNDKLG